MFCILITTFNMAVLPAVRTEQASPCYASLEQCKRAIPMVAHQITPVVGTGMAFRCEREERAI